MGLDIHISTDNSVRSQIPDYYNEQDDYFNKHSLSRSFFNLMNRQTDVVQELEIDQISKIAEVDLSSLYEMESYPNEDYLEYQLEYAETEEEKQSILKQAEADKLLLHENINKVLQTINSLIEKLMKINNLSELLVPANFDSSNLSYFSDFEVDKKTRYIDNNFGQDLRNFKRFLEFAKEHGTTSVWFEYG
ncbi:MAG: hypothetical protein EOP43_02395 [Sphingobacteriaceae bacterium]|nr:MAG: hypothetical protein EOP43_02395 [Sphingobacteriaceae bacterium]